MIGYIGWGATLVILVALYLLYLRERNVAERELEEARLARDIEWNERLKLETQRDRLLVYNEALRQERQPLRDMKKEMNAYWKKDKADLLLRIREAVVEALPPDGGQYFRLCSKRAGLIPELQRLITQITGQAPARPPIELAKFVGGEI